jgi:hypothetical protein
MSVTKITYCRYPTPPALRAPRPDPRVTPARGTPPEAAGKEANSTLT